MTDAAMTPKSSRRYRADVIELCHGVDAVERRSIANGHDAPGAAAWKCRYMRDVDANSTRSYWQRDH
jgi:hypothetical protein